MVSVTSAIPNICPQLSHYAIVEQIYEGARTRVYRAIENSSQRSVVIKILQQEHPSFNDLLHFRNQYTIAKNLNIPGIIRPYSLEGCDNGYALVMEDFGGISLDQYTQTHALTLQETVAIALNLAEILHELHQAHVIHKDIKSANILIHPESKQIKLIDFSIASLLPKETLEIKNLTGLEGTLAYLAPEQTGRMNRGIDYRADFYALGVTLFELLTGQLPFQSSDPMELMHCHLAKTPASVHHLSAKTPVILSNIVSKLMAKNAEDRYQTALGLQHDLQICLHQLQATGWITAFAIGSRDVCDRFTIPEKLYGRETEVQTLLQVFDRVAAGASELMLVAGFSGIGKTAVINEVHKPITRQQGYFIKGKFDQFNRNIPFSGFVQALRSLMGQLFSESDSHLRIWKARILETLGEHAQVIIDVIPELERIIGHQPPAPELSGTAAQNRFNLLFQSFIRLFTTPEHPLVVFLDDLQWADLASLNLMQLLVEDSETGYLFVIGAYRDNEVFAAHPLRLMLNALGKAGASVNTITLQSLSPTSLNNLIADTLRCSPAMAQPLTELIAQKTQGNPFFATQFLKALYQDGLITFDPQMGVWQSDIVQVQAAAITDEVVELMVGRLQKLPEPTQTVLQLAACIGNQFDLSTLAIISEQTDYETAIALWPALQENLVLPQSDVYKFYLETCDSTQHPKAETLNYKFLHDRVQQAAYSLIPAGHQAAIHYRIGRLLLQYFSAAAQEERIFEIVGQLNHGNSLMLPLSEQMELARLNLIAGRKAMVSTAYSAALDYLNQGISLLPEDSWTQDYALTLELHNYRLEAAYLNTRFEDLERWGEGVLQQATSILDRIKVYETRIMAYRSQGRFLEAVETGLQVLKLLGFEFPLQPTPDAIGAAYQQSRQRWQGHEPLNLLSLPTMREPLLLAAMQILTKIVPSAHIAAPSLLPLLVFKQVELSIQHGNCPISIFSYADYGLILCGIMGDLTTGYEFGQLSLALLEHLQITPFKSRAYFIVNSFIRHWKEPLHQSIPLLLEGYRSGLESGDWECVGLNLLTYSHYQYWAGRELRELAEEMATYQQVIQQVQQEATLKSQQVYQQAVLNLLGQAEVPYCLQGDAFDTEQSLPLLRSANDRVGLFHVYINQTVLCYLFEQYEQAEQQAKLLEEYSDGAVGFFLMPVQIFYDALIHLRRYSDALPDRQRLILDRTTAHQAKLQDWATHAPVNHQHRWQLVAAEQYRVLNQTAAAISAYDLAIAAAKTNGYLQEEALANELAAKFYLDWGKEKVAAVYMEEAYYCYAHWGAQAKTDDLETRYPNLLRPILQQAVQPLSVLETLTSNSASQLLTQTTTTTNPASRTSLNTTLDFVAILKASQSLSGTIQLDELLHQLTQTILKNSGGDRCALILPNGAGAWRVAAIATPETTELCSEPLAETTIVPVKLIQYVKNTQEVVVIDNLKTHLPVIDDYLMQQHPKSILCLPILNQGHLIGILYLKNRLARGVFTSDRILILNFLCTQAAISLENARLYQQSQLMLQELQQSQQLLRNIINTVPQFVSWKDRHSTYLGCNQKFADLAGMDTPEAIIGKTDHDLPWSKETSDLYRAYDHQIMESKQADLHIVEAQPQKDGSTIWVDISKIPLCNESGEVYGILASYEDITERKQAEETILQKSQELEKALAELQSAQLQTVQNEKMASLGNLVAGVAHEINNPIGFLNGSINNARDYVKDLLEHLDLYRQHTANVPEIVQDHAAAIDLEFIREDLPKLVNSMKGATDRIKSISTSLRTFSRTDTEHKVSANLHEGIDSTLLILKYRLKANAHRPAIQVIQTYGELPLVNCFPGQINQVFMNILANAIDAFDEVAQQVSFADLQAQPQKIMIQTAVLSEQNAVEIRIRDNGKGMSENVTAKVFDHFFTTKGVGKGTGLGLAIARQIVIEKHCGSLEVHSELDQGTEFCICLSISG